MTHGKTDTFTQEQQETSGNDMKFLIQTEPELFVKLQNATEALDVVRNTIDELHDRYGVNSHPFIYGVEVADITYPSK